MYHSTTILSQTKLQTRRRITNNARTLESMRKAREAIQQDPKKRALKKARENGLKRANYLLEKKYN